jgi:hypothetical protein
MNLYTVIFEFKEGTYCSQHYSINEKETLLIAIKKNIEDNDIPDFKEDLLNEVIFWLEETDVVPLNGLDNIWYFSFPYEDESHHCHIIKTLEEKGDNIHK